MCYLPVLVDHTTAVCRFWRQTLTSPLSPKEPRESSSYSELFEEFYLKREDLGKILSVGGPEVGIL